MANGERKYRLHTGDGANPVCRGILTCIVQSLANKWLVLGYCGGLGLVTRLQKTSERQAEMARNVLETHLDEGQGTRQGVLILAPAIGDDRWTVLGLRSGDEGAFVRFDPFDTGVQEQFDCDDANDALVAAREVLTFLTERRTPGLQAHFVPYLQDYVKAAEQRGQNRAQVVAQLLSLLDNQARRTETHRHS